MRYELIGFQADAVDKLIRRIKSAQAAYRDDSSELSAIVLTAPTGAGKTVIATSVVEQLLYGGDSTDAVPGTTVLWITSDPALNIQTMRKMMDASEKLHDFHVIGQGATINQPELEPGTIYLLNTQAAGAKTRISNKSDTQLHTIWETIERSVNRLGEKLIVIVDEAHHGVGEATGRRDQTILNKILAGPPAIPVFVGITATSERLDDALRAQASRSVRRVAVPIDEVRLSGLIKDRVVLGTDETAGGASVSADTTFVRLGVQRTIQIETAWHDYANSQNETSVVPALVIQVGNTPSAEGLRDVVHAVLEEWPGLRARQIVHTFGEHQLIDLGGGLAVRYMPPQNIQDSTDVRVVLAKNAITTGWDCPRAEVLVSLRTSNDYTPIAQLIGRIVRQPLARRVESDERLNKVTAYLPYFNAENVSLVIGQFQKGSDEPPIEAVRAVLTYSVSPNFETILANLRSLPTYMVPSQTRAPAPKRLNGLAAHLAADSISPNAPSVARERMNLALDWERVRSGDQLEKNRQAVATSRIVYTEFGTDGGSLVERTEGGTARLDRHNIDDLFNRASRILRDGLAEAYWGYLVDHDDDEGSDVVEHKITVAALALESDLVDRVHSKAEELLTEWLKQYAKPISDLPESRRAVYDRIRAQSWEPQAKALLSAPDVIEENAASPVEIAANISRDPSAISQDNRWKHHLYQDTEELYWKKPTASDGLERKVLEVELSGGAVAWYRNPPGGDRALSIPYRDSGSGKWARLHPDFIVWHQVEGVATPSIVDPHGIQFEDWRDKLIGLMDYADKHGSTFRSINPITEIDGKVMALAIQDEQVRAQVRRMFVDHEPVEFVFREIGMLYL